MHRGSDSVVATGSPGAAGQGSGCDSAPFPSLERLGMQEAPFLQSRGPCLLGDAVVAGSPQELQIEACWEHSPAPPRKCPLSSPTGSPSEESAGQPASLPASQRPLQLPSPQHKGSRAAGAGLGPGARCPRSWPSRRRAGRSVPAAGLPRCLEMGLIQTRSDRCGMGVHPRVGGGPAG